MACSLFTGKSLCRENNGRIQSREVKAIERLSRPQSHLYKHQLYQRRRGTDVYGGEDRIKRSTVWVLTSVLAPAALGPPQTKFSIP